MNSLLKLKAAFAVCDTFCAMLFLASLVVLIVLSNKVVYNRNWEGQFAPNQSEIATFELDDTVQRVKIGGKSVDFVFRICLESECVVGTGSFEYEYKTDHKRVDLVITRLDDIEGDGWISLEIEFVSMTNRNWCIVSATMISLTIIWAMSRKLVYKPLKERLERREGYSTLQAA